MTQTKKSLEKLTRDGKPDIFATGRAKEAARFELITDTSFYAVLCFETREQRDEFHAALKARGLDGVGPGDRYVDGLSAAHALGIDLVSPRAKWPGQSAERKARAAGLNQVPDERPELADPPRSDA